MNIRLDLKPSRRAGNRPRVVQVTTVPASLPVFLRGHVAFMKERGFDVHAISSPAEALEDFARTEKVPVHPVAMQRRIAPLQDLAALWRLVRTLRTLRPQIVHARTPKGGLLGSLAAWVTRVPVRVYTIHGLPMMTATGVKRQVLRWSERVSCWCAHRVLCVSPSVAEVAVRERLCPAAKIKVLGRGSSNGVDAVGRFNPKNWSVRREEVRRQYGVGTDDLVVGFVGRIVRDKGVAELAAAWRILREQFERLHLLLVGPFETQDPLPAEAMAILTDDPRIHLAGEVREAAPYYAAMDVCVLPTYREGLPNILLEAAAMRLPTVATQIPGCRDAVEDGVTGLLVPPHDAEALADALRCLLASPSLRDQLGAAGRERVLRDFRPELIHRAHYEEYAALLKAKGLSVPPQEPTMHIPLRGRDAA